MQSKISFHGGVGSVTGANFLLETNEAKILVDCGLIQGSEFAPVQNCEIFSYDPAAVDVLLVTHAHADHIGRIPKLLHDGFTGEIYSTPPTRDLARVMLEDAYGVMQMEAEKYGHPICYDHEDIEAAFRVWKTNDYHAPFALKDGVTATFTDAGHILGSAMITLERNGKKFLFTGDVGNSPQPLLNPPEVVEGYDYLLMESVYGDRLHEGVRERTALLKRCIEDTIRKGGTLIIPAFSLERTQAMLFEINNFVETGAIPAIPVFLDSPLAIKVTDLYRKHQGYLKKEIIAQIEGGDDIFDFPKFKMTRTVAESSAIEEVHGPKIVIAGSGMSHGGRILSHEKKLLEDPKTTLLLVGYQAVGSIGRLLEDGAKRIRIDGVPVKVIAKVAKINGYSGHADRDQLMNYVSEGCSHVKKVFVCMGEERSALFLVQRLHDYLGLDATAPAPHETYDIEF
jgi:metallo-beta-lactamase family protein